jgi:hypothetical protein
MCNVSWMMDWMCEIASLMDGCMMKHSDGVRNLGHFKFTNPQRRMAHALIEQRFLF